jgi:hypothetical protein
MNLFGGKDPASRNQPTGNLGYFLLFLQKNHIPQTADMQAVSNGATLILCGSISILPNTLKKHLGAMIYLILLQPYEASRLKRL